MFQPPKLLIVDDHPESVRVLHEMLQDDYEVFFATDGVRAIPLVSEVKPNLILLDMIMPEMTGQDVCHALKNNTETAKIPIIFVTVLSSGRDEKRGFELGAVDYITKPFNPTAVKMRIKNQLELSRHRERLENRVQQRTVALIEARDAANRRELEAKEREDLLWTILESSLDAFVMANHQGKIIDFNPAAEKLFGYTRKEIMGQAVCQTIVPVELREKHLAALAHATRSLLQGKELVKRRMIVEGLRADGQRIDLEIAISTVMSQGKPVFTGFLRDITSTKQLLFALHDALSVAESSSREKDQFLANMSHEIRTPMNGVLGMIDLALRNNLSEQTRTFLTHAKSSSHLLLRVINDILDFSKIEAGKMVMESTEFYLGDVLEDAVNLFRSAVTKHDVELVVSAPPRSLGVLVGDRLRLQQVLINLTSNAIKFTEAGEICLRVALLEQRADEVCLEFSVQDTGIGLSPEQLACLFLPFVQADTSTTRRFGGTGLGLAICKHLVERLGGKIWVESTLNVGSTFYFTVVLKSNKHAKFYAPVVDAEVQGSRLLLVDDNVCARAGTVDVLSALGIASFHAVDSGQEALVALRTAAARGTPYDLVLLDWEMPGMDGISTAQQMTASTAGFPLPKLILMTARQDRSAVRQAAQVGASRCLFKPVTPSLLLAVLSEAYGKTVARPPDKRDEVSAQAMLAQPLANVEVLLVDDNAINQQVAQEILASVGMCVTVANNGQEAVDQVDKRHFDIVLMDIQMPIMDGYKATRILRQVMHCEALPIIAMTANALAGDRENCLAAGMNDYVPKPIDIDQLFKTLVKWIPSRSSADAQGGGWEAPASVPASERIEAPTPAAPAGTDAGSGEVLFLPETFAGIHWAEGLHRVRGNRALMKKVILRFGEENALAAQHIRALLAEEAWDEAAAWVHAIKGVAGNIAAVDLHQCACTLEEAIKNRVDEETLAQQMALFDQAMAPLLALVETLKQEATLLAPPPESGSLHEGDALFGTDGNLVEGVQAQLDRLLYLLETQDLDSEAAFLEVQRAFHGYAGGEALSALHASIQDYAFSEAKEALQQWMAEQKL